jgi:hypothetical protein
VGAHLNASFLRLTQLTNAKTPMRAALARVLSIVSRNNCKYGSPINLFLQKEGFSMNCVIKSFAAESAGHLMEHASMTVHDYMRNVVDDIDAQFGEGYAQEHPELVGQLVQACAIDFATAVFAATANAFLTEVQSAG